MTEKQIPEHRGGSNKIKFVVGGLLIAAAIVYLIISSLQANTQYYLTVEETLAKYAKGELEDRNLRVSGAVIGDSINYDVDELRLEFTIVHIPGTKTAMDEEGGLAKALHLAVNDPTRKALNVVYEGPKPDLLQDEAQAIMTGQIGEDGVFYADEVLLKCPTKYEEAVPEQAG
jgi:cytochrome c-type biogenesis protein CcmE